MNSEAARTPLGAATQYYIIGELVQGEHSPVPVRCWAVRAASGPEALGQLSRELVTHGPLRILDGPERGPVSNV